ncbi:MAG: tetratricopeptide repeat protein, partial [Dehalococcoidia bacterium]
LGFLADRERWDAYLRLATPLLRFWDTRGYQTEGRRWLERGLAATVRGDVPGALRARALNTLGQLIWRHGEYDAARLLHEEALTIAEERDDTLGVARALTNLGVVAHVQGNVVAARSHYEEALPNLRALDRPWDISLVLSNLGLILNRQGEPAAALAALEESVAIRRRIGDLSGLAGSLNNLALLAHERGDTDAERALVEEALSIGRAVGNKQAVAASLNDLALGDRREDNVALARARVQESLALYSDMGYQRGIATSLALLGSIAADADEYGESADRQRQALVIRRELGDALETAASLHGLARIALWRGDAPRAARLQGAAAALSAGEVSEPGPEDPDTLREATLGAIDERAYRGFYAEGAALSPDEAVAYALEWDAAAPSADAPTPRAVESAPASPAATPHPAGVRALTNREQEILRQVADGRSNKEIARALVVSVRTVERHVTNIYAKIGARGRAVAATYVVQHGLGASGG